MAAAKYIILVALLTILIQDIQCKGIRLNKKPPKAQQGFLETLSNQIRDSALNSWNFVKKFTENTRENVRKWTDNARAYAEGLQKAIQKQGRELQRSINSIISNALGSGDIIESCRANTLNSTVPGITAIPGASVMGNLSNCLSLLNVTTPNPNVTLGQTRLGESSFDMDDAVFNTNLEIRLEACKAEENYEECLKNVRDEVFDEIQAKQLDIDNKGMQMESRLQPSDLVQFLQCVLQLYNTNLNIAVAESLTSLTTCILNSR